MNRYTGVTKNAAYNDLLAKWERATGEPQQPQCEECGHDVTGDDIHDTGVAWVCGGCKALGLGHADGVDENRAEARALGFTALD